jgi:hypothetical protein
MIKEILKIIYRNSNIINNFSLKSLYAMKGGGNELKVSYNDFIYEFEKSNLDDDHYILYSLDGKENECISLIISVKDNLVELHGIGNYTHCLYSPSKLYDTNINIGSHLLKITLKMIKKYRSKLNINKIILKDNSIKNCGTNKIKLTKMLILLTGHTWYGKYGFRPRDEITFKIDKYKNKHYENNIKIMDTLTISDIDLVKYIKQTLKDTLIKQTIEAVENNPKMLLKEFLSIFLKNYDKTCKYFIMFYEELYDDIGLTDFQGGSFVLIIE